MPTSLDILYYIKPSIVCIKKLVFSPVTVQKMLLEEINHTDFYVSFMSIRNTEHDDFTLCKLLTVGTQLTETLLLLSENFMAVAQQCAKYELYCKSNYKNVENISVLTLSIQLQTIMELRGNWKKFSPQSNFNQLFVLKVLCQKAQSFMSEPVCKLYYTRKFTKIIRDLYDHYGH